MSSSTGASSTIYLIYALLLVIVLRRLVRTVRGMRANRARTIAYSLYYIGFAAVLVASSFVSGVATYYAAAYAGLGILAAYGSYRFSDSRMGFWKGEDGFVYFKGAAVIYVVYVIGLLARLGIDVLFIGPQAFEFAAQGSPALTNGAIDSEIVTDLLLSFGAGLLVGRNLRVLRRLSLIEHGRESVGNSVPTTPV